MPRKKIVEDVSDVDAANNLADDEEIVISNVQTIKKNRRPESIAQPLPDKEFIEIEDEPEDTFPEGTLGSLLSRSEDEQLKTAQCNILVVRKPDSAGEKFLKPCVSRISESPLRNIELNQSQTEIEELVRTYYGGGHYYLQIQLGNQIQTGWSVDLADPPEAIAKSQIAAQPPPAAVPALVPPEPVNPFDQFFDTLRKQREMKELLFGEEMKELERLRREAADRSNQQPAAPQSEALTIIDYALRSQNPQLTDKLLAMAFPDAEDGTPSHWAVDLLKTGFEHKEELASLAQMVLGSFIPQPQPQAIEALMRSQPPTPQPSLPPNEPVSRSNFRRRPQSKPAEPESDEPAKIDHE